MPARRSGAVALRLRRASAAADYAVRRASCSHTGAAARERTRAIVRAALDDAVFERLLAEGQTLRDEEVEALAFADHGSV
jgi:hypothetical protein